MSEPWPQTSGFTSNTLSRPYHRLMNTSGMAFRDHAGSMVSFHYLMSFNPGPRLQQKLLFVSVKRSCSLLTRDVENRTSVMRHSHLPRKTSSTTAISCANITQVQRTNSSIVDWRRCSCRCTGRSRILQERYVYLTGLARLFATISPATSHPLDGPFLGLPFLRVPDISRPLA